MDRTLDTYAGSSSCIPLVPLKLHEHLFGYGSATEEMKAQMAKCNVSNSAIEKLQLPGLKCTGNLMEHFMQIGKEQYAKYKQQMDIAMNIQRLPPLPRQWVFKSGWTVYNNDSTSASVSFPDEKLLFFDVEVCMRDGKLPTIAVAVSPNNWYSWCSERLVNNIEIPNILNLNHMIPLEDSINKKLEKLVIGHNIAYDRQFVREQYLQEESQMKFWCTMSMHIACAGMADHQRNLYDKEKLNKKDFIFGNLMENGPDGIPKFSPKFQKLIQKWKEKTCKNSLEEVYRKYCRKNTTSNEPYFLNKKLRDVFVKEDINRIRENLQKLFNYCASDVRATFEIFQNLYPVFCQRFPHPITACGMMEMANVYLPITGNWRRFFEKCENISSGSKSQATKGLIKSAQELVHDLCIEDKETGLQRYQLDPWMWVSDWSRLSKRPEWPVWYFNMFQSRADAIQLHEELNTNSVRLLCREIPRIFGLCYGPYPIFFKTNFGWGFLSAKIGIDPKKLPTIEQITLDNSEVIQIPVRKIYGLICKNRLTKNDVITRSQKPACTLGIFDFYRLPHPNGRNLNVGTPFAKANKLDFEQDVIYPTRFENILKDYLISRSTTRFWVNYRDRYQEQLSIWLDEDAEIGTIAPSVIPAGTITRRAVHKLWLTSANPKKDIVGSELKSMVQCNNVDYFLVGADVDSQEQWIAALFGDSVHQNRRAGATPFSKMLLAGNKTEQTDLHSVVAKQVGISRDHAKVLNYARLYGSGILHAEQFLKQQGISTQIAKQLSKKLFQTTKGKDAKYYTLTDSGVKFFMKFLSTKQYAKVEDYYLLIDGKHFIRDDIAREYENWVGGLNITGQLYVSKIPLKLYRDGFESHTFNFLSIRSSDLHPVTPILQCWLSSALEPFQNNFSKEVNIFNQMFKRTVINWFVQSSAVDFLHMLLVCMRWLCQTYKIEARFVISIHDEVRYIVSREDRYRCALALTLSNMYVRAAISEALGIRELPRSIAFFSQVDVDKVLRKEVTMECQMPDGKIVPQGETLDIEEIIEKTGGFLNEIR